MDREDSAFEKKIEKKSLQNEKYNTYDNKKKASSLPMSDTKPNKKKINGRKLPELFNK